MRLRRTDPTNDLATLDWFAGLSREAIRAAGRHADRCDVAAGTRLQRRGMQTRWLWIVTAGALETHRDGEIDDLVLPGSAWGEIELVLRRPADVDVIAAVPSTVLSFPANAYHGLFAESSFAAAAARRLAGTIALLHDDAEYATPTPHALSS